jgi:hypothetical protein
LLKANDGRNKIGGFVILWFALQFNFCSGRLEQLLEHGNLNHLKMADHDLSLFQYFSLDVILFLVFTSIIVWTAILVALKSIGKRVSSKIKND